MLDLRKLKDSESRVTFGRRVRNICSRFSDHGYNLDHHHFLMASSTQHFDVFVIGLISSARHTSKKGRLRHLSCRILWLQDMVMEKRLMVRAVMGALNPADVATKRLSAARLESLCLFLGIWRGNNLEGAHDPGNIFRHVSTQRQHQGQSHYQVNLLISALSLLTQLQGCADAMELATEANSNFGLMVVFTWLVGLMGYLYMALRHGHHQGSFDYVAAHVEPEVEPDNIDPMVIESDGLSESSEPIFSSAGLIHWLHRRCERRLNKAVLAKNPQKVCQYQA